MFPFETDLLLTEKETTNQMIQSKTEMIFPLNRDPLNPAASTDKLPSICDSELTTLLFKQKNNTQITWKSTHLDEM